MNKLISKSIESHFAMNDIFTLDVKNKINLAYKSLNESLNTGGTIFWCGNGGSSSQANHLSSELVGGMYTNKIKPFRSICLNTDNSFLTAWSNDSNYNTIFSRQLEALSKKDDIVVCLSTSGNSLNILEAAKFSNHNNLQVISLTGNDGGELKNLSDININIPMKSTQRIQEMHILIGHIICDLIERNYIS